MFELLWLWAWRVILFGVGALIGSKAPDVDLAPVFFIRHRSFWTHGPAFGLLAWWAAGVWPAATWALIGFCVACCVHLLKDALPKSWRGSALINFAPAPGQLPALASAAYIFLSALYTGFVAWSLYVR